MAKARWTKLPDQNLEIRTTREGSFWRHDPPHPCQTDEGEGPYDSPDEAAREGADYARYLAES